jgi:tripartite ATP-independent transporter DctM subunit
MILGLLLGFGALIAIGVPVAFALGAIAVAGLLANGNLSLLVVASRVFGSIDSFTLLAIPFFVLAGDLFDTGGIARRLMRLAQMLVGHLRGGLGGSVVIGEIFFSGISGSTTADTAAIGAVMIPTMTRSGYSAEQAAAIVCAAAGMGILVPPCLTMVVYGGMTSTSIAALFAAGFLPAFVMAAGLLGQIHLHARRAALPRQQRASLAEIGAALRDAGWALLMPVIIFGGILGGAFTPTEAAVVAAVYGIVIGRFVYRELTWRDIWGSLVRTGKITGAVMLLLATAGIFGWLLTILQLPQQAAAWFGALAGGKTVFLLLTLVFFLLLFALLDGLPAMIMVLPVFLPVLARLGVDALHFGIVITALMGLALFMPPVGVGLYVAAGIAGTSPTRVGIVLLPYLANMFVIVLLITFVPWLVMIVPHLLGFAVPI